MALGLVLLAGAVLWARSEWSVRRHAAAARAAVARGEYTEARGPLEHWLRTRPGSAEAHYLMAQVAFATGTPEQAEAELAQAQALGYPEGPLERLRAFLLVRSRRYEEAEPLLVHALQQAPGPDPELDEALARVYLQTYKLDLASRILKRWMRDAPGDPRPYLWQTEIDRRTETDPTVTVSHYRAALERDPDLDAARLGLAETLRSAHRSAEAVREYESYLARHPDDLTALVGAGISAIEQGDPAAAGRFLGRALVIDPDNTAARKEQARLALARGAGESALQDLDRAERGAPFDAEVHHLRGLALTRLGRSEEARAAQQRAAELRQDEQRVLEIRRRLNQDPWNNDLRYEIARWLLQHGQDEAGLQWARIILAARPDHAPTHRLLADYYEGRGEAGLANYHRVQAH